MEKVNIFKNQDKLPLESGQVLDNFELAYHTYGKLNSNRSNVVWICHALTANSDPIEWWPGLVGYGKLLNPTEHFIICVNMLGSCYGSTGPSHINVRTGRPYRDNFPLITIRDMVNAYIQLADYLGIDKIYLSLGGSTGGMQVMEWAIMQPERFHHIGLIACNAQQSPWGIAFNESQRMAILADPTIHNDDPNAGAAGLEAARSIAMLSYRHYLIYQKNQSHKDNLLEGFPAASYQNYQGAKLQKRFNVWSYYFLSKAMDSHNVARARGGIVDALGNIKAKTAIVGIDNDLLFVYPEQELLYASIRDSKLYQINSVYGHDAFLIEYDQLTSIFTDFLNL